MSERGRKTSSPSTGADEGTAIGNRRKMSLRRSGNDHTDFLVTCQPRAWRQARWSRRAGGGSANPRGSSRARACALLRRALAEQQSLAARDHAPMHTSACLTLHTITHRVIVVGPATHVLRRSPALRQRGRRLCHSARHERQPSRRD